MTGRNILHSMRTNGDHAVKQNSRCPTNANWLRDHIVAVIILGTSISVGWLVIHLAVRARVVQR